jgi:phosphoglycerate dehydrogenase-like enzyme
MKFVAWMAYHLESRPIVDEYVRLAGEALDGHDLVICEGLESLNREIADADAMIGWRILPETFARAKKLKWIQFGSTGIDHTTFPELLASDVILTTLGGIHTKPVAEHVLAQMLALTRRLNLAMKLQGEHRFERAEIAATGDELSGKTVGIIGLGRIGLNIARLAKAFEMRVIGTKRIVEGPLPNVDELYPPHELDIVLPEADYLVLALPLTGETKALLGAREIGMMKQGARLINVARGAMVDHEALGEALKSGKLAGAALDVFPQEPLPPDSPIWDLPNVIITPHTGASTPHYSERAFEVFRHNLNAFLAGGRMINVYERGRGY